MLRLPNIHLLLSVFPDAAKVESIGKIMKELCFLMSHADNSFKTDTQIEDVKSSLNRLNAVLKSDHPDSSVILKLHVTAHLVPYLQENRQWGRISEQGLEAIPAVHNNFNRRHCSTKDPLLKTKLFLQMHMNKNNLYYLGRFWSR